MVTSNLDFTTRKVPSFLAGLVDSRARADGQIRRLTTILDEVQEKLATATRHRDACDRLLTEAWAALDAGQIDPINGWLGRYGKRGALLDAVQHCLLLAGPRGLSNSELYSQLEAMFGLVFCTSTLRKRWQSTIRRALFSLKVRGLAEPLHDQTTRDGAHGRWRWSEPDVPSVRAIEQLAKAQGVAVEIATDEDDIDDPRNHAQDSQLPQGAG
jgi:hypothetical protein